MAVKKASPKKATSTKKAPAKKKPTPSKAKPQVKAERQSNGKVRIAFFNRTDDAISEIREHLVSTDPFTELLDIRKGYVEVFGMLKKQSNPGYEQMKKAEHLRKILDQRHKNLMDLLDKLVPGFAMEAIDAAIKEAKDGADEFDANAIREMAFDKLAKELKRNANSKKAK